MKKVLSFLFLLFVPFMVHAAEVEIKSIIELEKIGDVQVNHEPSFKGMKIDFDLAFTNVGDAVKYKVVVKNNSDEDLEIEKDAQYGANKYIKYEAEFKEGTNVIKAGKEAEIVITASYDKEIPVEEFDNGVYNERGTVAINFVGPKGNPNTSTYLPIIFVVAVGLATITIILAKHNMKKQAVTLVLVTLLSVPVISIAARKISFDIESKIFIQDRCYKLDTTIGSFEQGKETKEICVPFGENKYVVEEYYTVQWAQRQRETDNLILNVMRTYFTENSYVRVYEGEEQLIEVKLSDFPKEVLNVTNLINYGHCHLDKSLGVKNGADLRIELSEDLQGKPGYEVAYFMYSGTPARVTHKGPWIVDKNYINQVEYLETFNTEDKVLKGFVRDVKDTHRYHAVWGAPDQIK